MKWDNEERRVLHSSLHLYPPQWQTQGVTLARGAFRSGRRDTRCRPIVYRAPLAHRGTVRRRSCERGTAARLRCLSSLGTKGWLCWQNACASLQTNLLVFVSSRKAATRKHPPSRSSATMPDRGRRHSVQSRWRFDEFCIRALDVILRVRNASRGLERLIHAACKQGK